MLAAHAASLTESDAVAWRRGYEREVNTMLRDGCSAQEIALVRMPAQILETDYVEGHDVLGGWLDLRDRLQGLLYQGEAAADPLERFAGIERRALDLLRGETDECLFVLFQALADAPLQYCATHALLAAVVCELAAQKIDMADWSRRSLFRAALLMNIGMARAQDDLARQSSAPSEAQRALIRDHPRLGADILRGLGIDDADLLDIVRWHHDPDESEGLPGNLESRSLLRAADVFVAKLAARKTRLALSPLAAAKSMVLSASAANPAAAGTTTMASAIATAVGFYPPGTYVQLVNGEKAVVVGRGPRAHDAHVVSIVNPGGIPMAQYRYRDIRDSRFAVRAPINAERIKVTVNFDKAFKTWSEYRP